MNIKVGLRVILTSFMLLNLIACAFVPKVDHQQDYAKHCEMYTKELTLDAVSMGGLDCGGNSTCVAVAGIVPVTTFLVSGSIVLVGNTLHWLEYQGSCDEGIIQSSLDKVLPDEEEAQSDAKPVTLLNVIGNEEELGQENSVLNDINHNEQEGVELKENGS